MKRQKALKKLIEAVKIDNLSMKDLNEAYSLGLITEKELDYLAVSAYDRAIKD